MLRVQVEHGGGEARGVVDPFVPQDGRRRRARHQLAGQIVGVELQFGFELLGHALHRAVAGETGHVERLGAAVARRLHDAAHQLRADAAPAPADLDREGGFRRPLVEPEAHAAQFAGAAHHAVDEIAVDDVVDAEAALGIVRQEFVADGHGEPVVPALGIQPQQMIAEGRHIRRPQASHDAAVNIRVFHFSLQSRPCGRTRIRPTPPSSSNHIVRRNRLSKRKRASFPNVMIIYDLLSLLLIS